MAQYYTDFSEYADLDAFRAEWTPRFNSSSVSLIDDPAVEGGKYIRFVMAHGYARRAYSWDAIDSDLNRDEVDVLCRCRTSHSSTTAGTVGVIVRGSGGIGTETGYAGQHSRIVRYNSGSGDVLASNAGIGSGWFWLRFKAYGTSLSLSIWNGGLIDEPAPPVLQVLDSSVSPVGFVGLFAFNLATDDWSVFSVGTNGDPAPTAPVPVGPTTPASLITSNIMANSFRAGWTP